MSISCPRCGTENEDDGNLCRECRFPLAERASLIKGRYRMVKPYIFSTFRAVYLAEDIHESGRYYSVREFLPQILSSGNRLLMESQFERLTSHYRALEHRNLAGIADAFIEGNYYRVIYDYVDGLDITKYLSNHKILTGAGYPESLVAHWVLKICDLFEYLHCSGPEPIFLVDFKPAGVVFRKEDEELVFIDMGLSKILSILGPHYLITEDFQSYRRSGGNYESIQWDLFCLGNFMYYLLSGIDLLKVPDNMALKIEKVCPGISEKMASIVTKAVGAGYRSDYGDIREIKQDILSAIKPLPLKAFDFYRDFVGDRADSVKISWHALNGNFARTNCSGYSPRPPVHFKWKCKTKASSGYYLAAGNSHVYALSNDGYLFGINGENGELDWNFFISKNIGAPPLSVGNMLYLLTPTGELRAIEHGATQYKWKLPLEGTSMTAPLFIDDIIFVALYNGTVCAVNAMEGHILTRIKVEGNIIAAPVVYENAIIITSLNRFIYAVDVDSDRVLWQFESETGFSSSPSLCGRTIYAGSYDGTLSAIDVASGEPLWTRNFKGPIPQTVRASEEMIFIPLKNGRLTALSAARGDTLWEIDLGLREGEYPLALGTNFIFTVDADKNLITADIYTGKEAGRIKMSHQPVSQLIIAHRQVYLVSGTGHLAAFGRR